MLAHLARNCPPMCPCQRRLLGHWHQQSEIGVHTSFAPDLDSDRPKSIPPHLKLISTSMGGVNLFEMSEHAIRAVNFTLEIVTIYMPLQLLIRCYV